MTGRNMTEGNGMEFKIETVSDGILAAELEGLHFEEQYCRQQIEIFRKRRDKALEGIMLVEAERERRKKEGVVVK